MRGASRFLFVVSLFALSCSAPDRERCDAGAASASPLATDGRSVIDVIDALGAFPAFADHLGRGGALSRGEQGWTVRVPAPGASRGWSPAGARPMAASLPARADGFLHLATQGASLEVRAEVGAAPTTAIEGAAIARTSDSLDLVFVAERHRVEEIRLARTPDAARTARWTLRTSQALRLSEGQVQVLGEGGRAALVSEPIFAVDARGIRREPSLELARVDASTWSLVARFDVEGLAAPIAIDPAWTSTEALGAARKNHTATLLADGRVLVVGGSNATTVLSSAEIYDPATDAWIAAGVMAEARQYHSASKLSDGRVLVVGGASATAVSQTAEIFDPATKTWKTLTLPQRRAFHASATLSDGKVLVAGGLSTLSGFGTSEADVLLPPLSFRADTETFTALAAAGAPPFPANPVVVGGDKKVFFVGGRRPGCAGMCGTERSSDVVVYEEASSTWRTFGTMRRARAALLEQQLLAASLFGDGKQIMIVGGSDDSGELMDVATGKSVLGGELPDLWAAPRMVRLASGDVFSVGGFVPTGPSSGSVLKLFPAPLVRHAKTLRWVNASPPARRRWDHTATVLADGRVLMVGGQNKDEVLASAELFQPLGLGQKCTDAGDCASAACVDGVCCDTPCGGQCEACSSSGKCLPVTGAPRGLRPLCDDPGTGTCSAKVCDGKTVDACVLPSGLTCAAAVCNVSSYTAAGTCDGKGACTKPAAVDCALYGCSDTGCRTSCAGPSDCANAAICVSGKCIAASGGACNAELTASVGTDGKETPCHPYRCVQASGRCSDACVRSDDCAGGFVCGGAGKCEQPTGASEDDGGGCATSRTPRGGAAALAIVGLALGALARRRRAR
ncbi:MAG: hypothetical protein HYV09_26135 [Deltaproteobacteria bacterium]|nr:hypothetical protein [Deltaproteobacteria bacterium]